MEVEEEQTVIQTHHEKPKLENYLGVATEELGPKPDEYFLEQAAKTVKRDQRAILVNASE
jgi:hypothetical protein